MRTKALLPLLTCAVLALAACGSDDSASGGADRAESNRDAALKFARCMRENGIDMPDPTTSEGGGIRLGGPGSAQEADPPSPETMRRAEEACRQYLGSMKPPERSEEDVQEFKERALAHARCMREEGLDFPDPEFGEDGTMMMHRGKTGDGLDPNSPKFREALETCREKTGGGPVVSAAPGGGS